MSDEGVRDAMSNRGGGNPMRGKLIEKMMEPYTPSFMRRELSQVRSAKPLDGLDPKAAEGIMRAIEKRLIPHDQWLVIHSSWHRIMASASKYKP